MLGLLALAMASCSSPPEYINVLCFKNSCPHVIHATAINDSNFDALNTVAYVMPGASAVVAAYISIRPGIARSLHEEFKLTVVGGIVPRTLVAGRVTSLLKTGRETRHESGSQFTITDSSICRPVDKAR